VPDEDNATVTIAGKQLNAGTIIKFAALAICVCFFLPFTVFSEGVETITASMVNDVSENILAILWLLMPAAIFIAFQFKKNLTFLTGKIFLISLILSIINIIIYGFAYYGSVLEANELNRIYNGTIRISFTFWYWLGLICYVKIGCLSFICKRILKKNKKGNI